MTLMLDTTALLARYLDGPFRPIVLDAMRSDEGFIRVRRLVLKNHYEGGAQSREYRWIG